MADTSQQRAIRRYRRRLSARGMARFEVLGLDSDRELIRSLASRLARNDQEASRIRASVKRTVAADSDTTGGIFAKLRRSPLVGADIDLTRSREPGRKVDL